MTASLLVLGAGGHGRVVADAAEAAGYGRIGLLDDRHPGLRAAGPFEVIGSIDAIEAVGAEWPEAIAAVGDNGLRLELARRIRGSGRRLVTIVHPTAIVSRHARLDEGVFVAAGAVVNIGARIGEAVIINTGARIDHDCEIGPGCHIAPGAALSGDVRVGELAWIGTGAAVRQNLSIGARAVVGVGAAVVCDLPPAETFAGVPAKPLSPSS